MSTDVHDLALIVRPQNARRMEKVKNISGISQETQRNRKLGRKASPDRIGAAQIDERFTKRGAASSSMHICASGHTSRYPRRQLSSAENILALN
jgi:hypothetical protein